MNLDEIEARADMASEGWWLERRPSNPSQAAVRGRGREAFARAPVIADWLAEADAAFIAAARTDVPALIARVRQLEAAQSTLAVQLQRLAPTWSHETKSWTMREAEDGPYTFWSAAAETIRATMWERDEAKKEAAESFKEMVMLYNDHSSTELEQQLRIEELTRERVKFQALAALGEGYRRERDEARDEVKRFRDWYRNAFGGPSRRESPWDQLAAADTGAPCDGHRHCCADRRKLAEELLRVRAERDALKEKP